MSCLLCALSMIIGDPSRFNKSIFWKLLRFKNRRLLGRGGGERDINYLSWLWRWKTVSEICWSHWIDFSDPTKEMKLQWLVGFTRLTHHPLFSVQLHFRFYSLCPRAGERVVISAPPGDYNQTSLMVQWFKNLPCDAGDRGSIPSPGIFHVPWSN